MRKRLLDFFKHFKNKWVVLAIDASLFVATGYLLFRRLTNNTLSDALMRQGWLTDSGFSFYLGLLSIVLGIVLCAKLFVMISNVLPVTAFISVPPKHIAQCLMRSNEEINRHIEIIQQDWRKFPKGLPDSQSFDANVDIAMTALLNQITETLKGIEDIDKDVLVTLYMKEDIDAYDNSSEVFSLLSWRPKNRKHLVQSRRMDLAAEEYCNYECAQLVHQEQEVWPVLNCREKNFCKPGRKRANHVKHYIGINLKCLNHTVGILNIELHNRVFFYSEDELLDWISENLITYQQLFQYQFMKRIFFRQMSLVCEACQKEEDEKNKKTS